MNSPTTRRDEIKLRLREISNEMPPRYINVSLDRRREKLRKELASLRTELAAIKS